MKTGSHPAATPHRIDPADDTLRDALIRQSDLVISLLPPPLHNSTARKCLEAGKHFLNASYLTEEMQSMHEDVRTKGLTFLCEMGLDPGIDHMSAMRIIDGIRNEGGKITSFRSHCGGLVAPESDDNPWHYKFSWNPRNVVMAGKEGAHYREDGNAVHVGYDNLFDPARIVGIPGQGPFAWYPNRDSLSYLPKYALEDIPTFVRTTLRHPDFCFGWRNLVQLKLTDDTVIYDTDGMSLSAFFQIHFDRFGFSEWLQNTVSDSLNHTRSHLDDLINLLEADSVRPQEDRLNDDIMLVSGKGDLHDLSITRTTQDAASGIASRMHEAKLALTQLFFLGLDSGETIGLGKRSAADILQWILEKRLALRSTDKDMIIMLHEIGYELAGHPRQLKSTLVLKGEDSSHTAMARTVGMPLGIAARLILNGEMRIPGVHIPVSKDIYSKVLPELEREGIVFREQEEPVI
jgi:saccharopine dehydrogenase-like NADP-dependent oxidoreductase